MSKEEKVDSELERLKARRLAEMHKNMSEKQKGGHADNGAQLSGPERESAKQTPPKDPRTLLVNILGFRGVEVLENAESQFPTETKMIVQQLSELIKTGEINESIDGGKLLTVFRSVGMRVRMATKINVEQDGKFVSLSDKLTNQSAGDGDGEQ